MNSTNG